MTAAQEHLWNVAFVAVGIFLAAFVAGCAAATPAPQSPAPKVEESVLPPTADVVTPAPQSSAPSEEPGC